ncbi:MAG: hypothetical protein K2L93_06430 [Muribaculaceae bacterium]|nr:hypothetical protein [Muribaculaceae bacterium]
MNRTPRILLKPGNSFIRKYILHKLQTNPIDPKQRIIEDDEAADIDYTIDIHDDHAEILRSEGDSVTLRYPMVIGTGMTGEAARTARMIYRGTYLHVKDSEARVSVIHATDVAAAVRIALTNESIKGVYTISDGVDPTRHDLAEALAWRLGQKRIYSLSAKKFAKLARWADRLGLSAYNTKQLLLLTTDAIVNATDWAELAGKDWQPQSTVEYLRTHIYDEHSL